MVYSMYSDQAGPTKGESKQVSLNKVVPASRLKMPVVLKSASWSGLSVIDVVPALVIACLTLLFLNHTVDFALDDSYITYRYAHHLELGYGPVFNVGERYLGTTAPGFAILLAVLHLIISTLNIDRLLSLVLGVDSSHISTLLDIPHLGRYVSSISVGIVALTGYAIILRAFGNWVSRIAGLIFALFVITLPHIVGVTGHETLTYVALVLLGFYFAPSRLSLSAFLLGCATLVRPDAALAFGIVVVAAGLRWLVAPTRKSLLQSIRSLSFYLIPILPWTLFAWFYYGSPIPGTLLAKQAQVHMGLWTTATFDLLKSMALGLIPGAIEPFATGLGVFGLVVAIIRRDVAVLVAGWGLLYIYTYGALNVTFWPWYATPVLVVYLFMVVYGAAAAVSLLWALRRAAGRSLVLSLASQVNPGLPNTRGTTEDSSPAHNVAAVEPSMSNMYNASYPVPRFSYLIAVPLLAIMLLHTIGVVTPWWKDFIGPRAIFLHTHSFREIADYVKQNSPDGASLATPEPGALAYFLGPKYFVLDTLGLTAPGVSQRILIEDYEWPYFHYRPDWILVTYGGKMQPNLGKAWFEAQYEEVEQFPHPYWDAAGMTPRLFRRIEYISGDNIVANGDFSKGENFHLQDWNFVPPTEFEIKELPYGSALCLSPSGPGDELNAVQEVIINGGKQYLMQFEYLNMGDPEMQRVYIQVKNHSGQVISTFPIGDGYPASATTEWKAGVFTFTPPEEARRAVILLRSRGQGEGCYRKIELREVKGRSS